MMSFKKFTPEDVWVSDRPLQHEPVMLRVDKKVVRLAWVSVVVAILVLISGVFFIDAVHIKSSTGAHSQSLVAPMFIVLLPLLASVLLAIYMRSLGPMRKALGIDNLYVVVTDYRGKNIQKTSIESVLTDGAYLLLGSYLFPLSHMRRDAFPRDALKSYLLAKLPRQNFVSSPKLFWRALCAGNKGLIFSVVIFCVVIFVMLMTKLQ